MTKSRQSAAHGAHAAGEGFGGTTYEEAAAALGTSRSSFFDDLRFAKAWLQKELA